MPTFSLPKSPPPARVSARKSVVFPEPGRPTMPTSSATTRSGRRSCFCSETSARCWSVLIAPSLLSRIVADVAVREVEDELQRQHLLLLGGERPRSSRASTCGRSTGSPRPRPSAPRSRPARAPPPRAASAGRRGSGPSPGCARSGTARPRTAPTASGTCRSTRASRRKVCVVRSSASCRLPTRHVQVAVDPVEVDQVQLLERVAVARLRALDELRAPRPRRPLAVGAAAVSSVIGPRIPVGAQR